MELRSNPLISYRNGSSWCCLGFSKTGQTAIERLHLWLEDLSPCCRREKPVHGFPQVSEKREFLSRLPFFLLFPSSF